MRILIITIIAITLSAFSVSVYRQYKFQKIQGLLESIEQKSSLWSIQSIDTMKYSRDLSREKLNDNSFDQIIDSQMSEIKNTGATHVAIGTPYDEEFFPILLRWIKSARKHNLKVWFRGNFSGWEGWFDYPKITRREHIFLTEDFIMKHSDIFENGDAFTPCPECENGGPGDPRITGDISGHQKFLITEHDLATEIFSNIHKDVRVDLWSMNLDVAKQIMNPETTKSLGGTVTVDHYVKDTNKFLTDIVELAKLSKGNVVIGEFGAPVPDLHGELSEEEQAEWIKNVLDGLARIPQVIGVNYWVSVGGSTAVWNDNGTQRAAVKSINQYFAPSIFYGIVTDSFYNPISMTAISSEFRQTQSNESGFFVLPILDKNEIVSFKKEKFVERMVSAAQNPKIIILTR